MNGYCELLALTNPTGEQAVYLTSIQQACHAINMIAGNVLGLWSFYGVLTFRLSLLMKPQTSARCLFRFGM